MGYRGRAGGGERVAHGIILERMNENWVKKVKE